MKKENKNINDKKYKFVETIKEHFKPLLDDWVITYGKEGSYYGECCRNLDTKKAHIYPFRIGPGRIPDSYFIHEMLHITIAALEDIKGWRNHKKAEEKFIQGLCALMDKNKLKDLSNGKQIVKWRE